MHREIGLLGRVALGGLTCPAKKLGIYLKDCRDKLVKGNLAVCCPPLQYM